jgi:major vault protein
LKNAQTSAVQNAINLSVEQQNLEATRTRTKIQTEVAQLEHTLAATKLSLDTTLEQKEAEAVMAKITSDIEQQVARLDASVAEQQQRNAVATATLERRKADETFTIESEEKRVSFFETKMKAITPDLIAAMNTLGNTEFATKLATAIAPLAPVGFTALSVWNVCRELRKSSTAIDTAERNGFPYGDKHDPSVRRREWSARRQG